ncbi:MAG: Uma2 family endonuclease [Lysobacteraceae bacterium]
MIRATCWQLPGPDDLLAERALRHPVVVIEVLAESTAAHDRGAKFAAYRQLPDLREYVLIDPDRRTIDLFRHAEGGDWLLATQDAQRGLILPSLDFEAPLAAVFEDLPADAPATQGEADSAASG